MEMTLLLRGRGGWASSSAGIARIAALAVLGIVLAAGCSSKSKMSNVPTEGQGTGIGEKTDQSSLTQLQTGELGANKGGPLTDIHFEYNAYTIEPQDGSILKQNASWLSGHPQARVQIEGHCDERGSEEYNIALGARRAQAAKDYLETLGVSSGRMSTISYGKELPLCTEQNESCWADNRRDHFVVQQ